MCTGLSEMLRALGSSTLPGSDTDGSSEGLARYLSGGLLSNRAPDK